MDSDEENDKDGLVQGGHSSFAIGVLIWLLTWVGGVGIGYALGYPQGSQDGYDKGYREGVIATCKRVNETFDQVGWSNSSGVLEINNADPIWYYLTMPKASEHKPGYILQSKRVDATHGELHWVDPNEIVTPFHCTGEEKDK